MEVIPDVRDLFEIAEQVENQGAELYTKLSQASPDASTREALRTLATMELDHRHVFSGMKVNLTAGQEAREVPDSVIGAVKFWKYASQSRFLDVESELARQFTGRETKGEAFRKAINFERDTIVFYVGLRDMFQNPSDRETIDQIIREELGHIIWLMGTLLS